MFLKFNIVGALEIMDVITCTFISEYWMPEERFECVLEIDGQSNMQGGGKKVIEKLFVPKKGKS